MKKKGRHFLSIKDKKRLLQEGKRIPICAYVNTKKEKKHMKEKNKLGKVFAKNIGIWDRRDGYIVTISFSIYNYYHFMTLI